MNNVDKLFYETWEPVPVAPAQSMVSSNLSKFVGENVLSVDLDCSNKFFAFF
jgi:hypothetical protein